MTAVTETGLPPYLGGQPRWLPEGAVKMSKAFLDNRGLPQSAAFAVPVDADDYRTPHVLHQCPHMIVMNGGGRERCPEKSWLLPEVKARFCPAHGLQLENAEVKKASRVVAVARDAAKLHGRSLVPWAIPAVGALVDTAAAIGAISPATVALAAPVLGVGVYVGTRRALTARAIERGRVERGQREGRRVAKIRSEARRYGVLAAESGLWATALTATDMSTVAGRIIAAAGMVRWAVGSYQWWGHAEERRNRGDDNTMPAPPPVVPPVDPVKLRAMTTWATLIGCKGGPLDGTEITEFRRLPGCSVNVASRTQLPNWSAKVIATIPGSINMREERRTLLGRIAAAYGCSYADVSFTADESDLSVGWLRVQPDNVLAETKLWGGPSQSDWSRGRSRIGRHDDGAPILYSWWNKTGAAHDLISGCTGSGKSEVVAQLLLAGLHSGGLVMDWVADPQGGQSYGALKDAVDWFARDLTEIKLMLLAGLKEMLRRNDRLAASNIKTWQASREMPLLVITLDEVQAYIDDPAILELVEKLVGQGRKCGIKLRMITQVPAAYNLGGSTYIKEQLKAGQTLVFRAMTDIAGRAAVEGDCPIDPTQLPSVWGANTCDAGETTAGLMFVQGINGRDVYGRADYTGEKMQVWLTNPDGTRSTRPGRFSPDAQQVSGVLWGDRKARAALLLAAGRSDGDLLTKGQAIELIEAASVAAKTGKVVQLPTAASPVPDRARDTVLSVAREHVDAEGRVRREQIVTGVKGKMADGTCNKALTDLVADGQLVRVRNGVYEVPGAATHEQLSLSEGVG